MFIKFLKFRLKIIASLLMLGVVFVFVVHAGMAFAALPGDRNDGSGPAVAGDLERIIPPDPSLAQGGQGLQIPSASVDVQLSKDIVQDRSFVDLVVSIINYVIGFLGLAATIVFVIGGVMWTVGGGSEDIINKAKKMMTYAVLGIIVIILSYSVVRFVTNAGKNEAITPPPTGRDGTNGANGINGTNGQNGQNGQDGRDGRDARDAQDGRDGRGGERGPQGPAAVSEQSVPAHQTQLDSIDQTLEGMEARIRALADGLRALPPASREAVDQSIRAIDPAKPDTIQEAVKAIRELADAATDPKVEDTLRKLADALNDLSSLREELDALKETMPQSTLTLRLYDVASDALDEFLTDPSNVLKLKRFNEKYKALKEAIAKFPVVSVGILALPGIGNAPLNVTFDGLNSVDPTGGTISQYQWSFLDSHGTQVSLGSGPVVTYTFTEPNTYSVQLRASTSNTDKEGYKKAADGVAFARIKVNPPATKVHVRINGKKTDDIYHATLEEGQAGIAFDPSESVPALGRTIERYDWAFGDSTTESRSTPITVLHTYPKPGDYFVRLTTLDNNKETDTRIIKLSVKSIAADIKITPEEGNVNTEFRFEGIDSRSDDGLIDKYEWTIYDADRRVIKESEKQNFSFKLPQPGVYQIVLLVTDLTGKQDKVIKTFKITSRPPISAFTWSIPRPNHPNRIAFNATASYDLDEGDTITYSWDFDGDGKYDLIDTPEINVEHDYSKVGDYKVHLQVRDQFGTLSSVQQTIHIKSILAADIKVNRRVAHMGESVTFEAKDSNAVAYFWEFGDGETSNTEKASITHTYTKEGKYLVRMTFFDKDDNQNMISLYFLVGQNDHPIASIDATLNGHLLEPVADLCGGGKEGIRVYRSDTIQFTAANSINIDGSSRLLLYNWDLGDGSKNTNREFSYRFTDLNTGSECTTIRLVVKDQASGAISADDTLYFRVENRLPELTDFVVRAERERELVTPVKVHLQAIGARDADGTIKKYKWWYYPEGHEDERLGVHSTVAENTDFVVTATGDPGVAQTYHFVLEMVDNDNGVYKTEDRFKTLSALTIKNGPNLSPVAEFKVDKTTVNAGDSITFVSTSYDPQGDKLPPDAFKWDFDGDGGFDDTSSGSQVNRKFNTPGEFNVRLKVTYRGLSSSISHKVFVETTQSFPQAAFTYLINGNEVAFDGSLSRYDPDLSDKNLRFEWDFDAVKDSNGNGINDDDVDSTEMRVKHTYSTPSAYRVRLKIKDSIGQETVAVREVNLVPTATGSQEQRGYQTLRFKATGSPVTTLDVTVNPADLSKNSTAEITARVINADNEPYEGNVTFEVLEGSATIIPNPAKATASKAISILTTTASGPLKIRVRAKGATFGEITEEIQMIVK